VTARRQRAKASRRDPAHPRHFIKAILDIDVEADRLRALRAAGILPRLRDGKRDDVPRVDPTRCRPLGRA
jgi:hypothetical protein